MPAIVRKTPDALNDLASQVDYIARHSVSRSERFLEACEATFLYLAQNPFVGFRCDFESPEGVGVRWWRVKRHKNHVVYYRPSAEGIDIIRLLHAARNAPALLDPPGE